jgi:hypothetical protein
MLQAPGRSLTVKKKKNPVPYKNFGFWGKLKEISKKNFGFFSTNGFNLHVELCENMFFVILHI